MICMLKIIRNIGFVLLIIISSQWALGQNRAGDADKKNAPLTVNGPYNATRTLPHDLLHTRLDLSFDWVRQWVHGIARLRFKPHFYPQNTLDVDAKGFEIKGVFLLDTLKTGETVFDTLNYTYNDRQKIHVLLPRTYTRADTFDIQIVYTAKPNERPLGGSAAISQDKGLYFINHDGAEPNKPRQIWTQGETEANSCWFPTIDTPNEKMTQEIYLTVENKYRTLSNGKLISSTVNQDSSRTDYWRQTLPHSPYLAMIAVGDFAYVRDSLAATSERGPLEVSYYVEPAYEKDARAIFGRTPAMVEFFEKKFGVPYVWEKYSQIAVRDFVTGAMENTTATVHGETVQMDGRQLVDGNSDDVISHELSHHWFGNLATAESWANLPLNEAFATYAEYLWREHNEGTYSADMHGLDDLNQYIAESETKQEPLIRYRYTDREQMFDSHSYAKGGRVLHLLRRTIGDDAFFESLTLYLKRHRFKTAELSDLREAFEEVTGEDLNWFFDQWFLKPGHPVIKIEKEYRQGGVQLTVIQQQDSTKTPIYRLPVKVDLWVKGQKKSYDVVVDKARQVLNFTVEQRPDLIVFDADHRIVGTVEQEKNKAELLFQFYHTDNYRDKYESITRLEDKSNLIDSTVRHMMMDAMQDKFWKIRQVAVGNFAEYDGQEFAEVERIVQSKARNDERSLVRQEGINTLASYADNVNDPLFREALNDTSYAVVSSALDSYLLSKPGDANEIAARFENVPNGDIVTAVANYYANSTDTSRYTWFINKMSTMKSQDLYNFLQVFGKYLIRSGADTQRQAIPMLEVMARTSPAYFVRFGAYQVLGLLQDIEGVKSMRKDIRLSERDPKLKEMYEQFKDF